jgi:hypothetical protein
MSPEGDFFRYWVAFLKPLHELANREMDVLAAFLKMRYFLSKEIIDSDRLDRVLMSEETKREIREKCGITPKHFQVIMSKFRKNDVIRDNRIRMNLIPIHLTYDKNFKTIKDVYTWDKEPITEFNDKKGTYASEHYDNTAKYFIK